MTASELSRLVALDISKTPEAFLDLPLPEESPLIGAAPKVLRRAVDNFYRSWIYLVSAKELHLRGEATLSSTGQTLNGQDLWWRLFVAVGTYYDFSIRLLLRAPKGKYAAYPLPGFSLSEIQEWVSKLRRKGSSREALDAVLRTYVPTARGKLTAEEMKLLKSKLLSEFKAASLEEVHAEILWVADRTLAANLAGSYVTALSAAVRGELLRNTNIPFELIEEMDGVSHHAAAVLFRGPPSTGKWPPQVLDLPQRLVATVFEQWVRIYDRSNSLDSHRIGPFSSI